MESGKLLIKLNPSDVGFFRFLLEARENAAFFTVLEKNTALVKLSFASESKQEIINILLEIKQDIELEWREWPSAYN